MRERDLETLLRQAVHDHGGLTAKITGPPGLPDRLVIWPGGRVDLVELKTATGRLSPIQRAWHAKAAERGVTVLVLRGPDQVREYVRHAAA